MLVVDVKGRPWVDRQAGISNISIELTLGITSLCLHRGFFFALTKVATLDGLPTDVVEGASDGAADEGRDYFQNSLAMQILTGQRQAGGSSKGKEN